MPSSGVLKTDGKFKRHIEMNSSQGDINYEPVPKQERKFAGVPTFSSFRTSSKLT
ncbi:hypothetical protein LEP1GSC193_0306 [Leptospira alstonii serovar Pingchang str. 80-412]|uniref:Uncharacterized protein n=2 Tax=Leptospira alstonii TaxID=28452 RepID=M6CXR1_9LEPT|nr:hypothetical protein LEP1GSC194_2059 [Leptospira alstonii serovar Sichuan str. 79601]EQA79124.1 hypothetical protein LEP1GSC193_0306 [Leptospira alstonii serovar Pingchang str. 80-412]